MGRALRGMALLALAAAAGMPQAGSAQVAQLEGSWSGGGAVTFTSGAREHARCRVHYSRRSNDSYTAQATCATASARADQTARLRRVAENRFTGTFYNSEYGVTGTIYVVVHGNTQSVRLTSSAGWASLTFRR